MSPPNPLQVCPCDHVSADRVEHHEAVAAAALEATLQQALRSERLKIGDRRACNGPSGLECRPAGKHGEASEHRLQPSSSKR